MPTLCIIDGYAQFFRAYHAIRTPMTSPVTKEPTNLTFGFVGLILKLLRSEGGRDLPCDMLACAVDVSSDRGTFRSALYPQYKATRPPPPEDLPTQVDRCLRLLGSLGVPVVGAEGFEADDVIATLVRRAVSQRPDLRVRIISKDKDLRQLLVPGRVEMYDAHTSAVIDAESLRAEHGITPAQVVDWLALMGDTVDNVPGVPGVGPKTAAELIAQHGSIAALLEHAESIKGKRGEAIRAAGQTLALSQRLVTLRDDAPVTLDLDACAVDRLRLEELLPILRELGFNRYQDEVRQLLRARSGSPHGPASQPPGGAQPGDAAAPPPLSPTRRPVRGDMAGQGGLFDDLPAGATTGAGAGGLSSIEAGAPTRGTYRCARTPADLAELIDELRAAPVMALDTETTGLDPRRSRLAGLCFSTRAGTGWYVPVRSPEPAQHMDQAAVLGALRPILERPPGRVCGHNLKFDLLVLRAAGVRFECDPSPADAPPGGRVFDSMVASYLIDASRSGHGLDALALALLGHTNISIKELLGPDAAKTGRTFADVPLDLATQYAAEDADVALRLMGFMEPQLRALGLVRLFETLEMPLVQALADLEWNGVRVEPTELDRQRDRLVALAQQTRGKIDDAAMESIGRTFNPDSPKQLAGALFNKPTDADPGLGLRPVKRTKTGPSTDAEVLESLAEDPAVSTPIPRLIVEYRQLTKLVSTYLVALREAISPVTGRIHASFHQTVAATGRLSSSDPNLQNIPIRTDTGREIRRAFVAEPGHLLLSADYSQIELRLLAHLSRDPALTEAFRSDEDIHTAVAAQVAGIEPSQVTRQQRSGAKMVNFGIVYGITAFGLARRLGITTQAADEIITSYKRRFAGITTFLQECVEQARRHGAVLTIMGRRRPIPDIDSATPARRALAERTAINSVVQGSAADLIKLAMVDLRRRLAAADLGAPLDAPDAALAGSRMLLQIHDELVFECPRDRAEAARAVVVSRMESAMSLSVPLRADSTLSHNWYDE
ncbi:MAG: DNA polymerase I [Planctomyces sp.]|nr:DNA polymerase I [Planctomyces sp.]